jgi:hypothetical protein
LKLNINEKEDMWRGVVRQTKLNGVNRDKFTAMKVPGQCPLVLVVKVG